MRCAVQMLLQTEECPAPQLKRKNFKSIGTLTVQANALSHDNIKLRPGEVLAAAQQRRAELEGAGEIDWVHDIGSLSTPAKVQFPTRSSS